MLEVCTMNIVVVFGTNVKQYRLNRGLSQEKFAELCDLHRTYISDIECFQRNISLNSVQKIAEALNIEPYMLFIDNNDSGEYNDK